jgi:hypothetical protein
MECIPIAFANVYISEALFVVVALMWIFPDRRIEAAMQGEGTDSA